MTATKIIKVMCKNEGRATAAPRAAESNAPIRYWDSTPILNKPILNPTATATAEMYKGTDLLSIETIDLPVFP